MIKIAIIGAAGRMGQALIRCCTQSKDVQFVAAVEQADCPLVGQDAGALAGIQPTGVKLNADLGAAVAAADVVIDFSFHNVVPETVRLAAERRKGVVLGTTGLTAEERQAVEQAARQVPVVWAPNMSVGVNLLFAMVGKAAAKLGLDYDVEIVETHHRHKKDAPSGTALRLGEKVAEGRGQDFKAAAVFGREGVGSERPRGQIGLHAVRAGDVVGDHTVTFATDGERVEFTHRASSRDAFARGALRAAAWLAGRQPGLYDMQDVIGLRTRNGEC
jgi:4-hydroxy-tetrahydrodipicolinate reductase